MSSESEQRLTGMVKWFNNKSGFGFVTVCSEGEFKGKDIFAHYSSIRVTNSQYKYLVQGEYVEFTLVSSESDKHEHQATDITGIMSGPILCETRRQALSSQSDEKRPRARRERPTRAVETSTEETQVEETEMSEPQA